MVAVTVWDQVAIERLSKSELKRLFEALYGHPAPPYIQRRMLLLAVGYAVQEAASEDLDQHLLKRFAKLDTEFAANGEVKLSKGKVAKPGTQLIREWQGVTHTVTVCERGFTHRNTHYRSLSAIARKITGAQWSGPKFFGIKRRSS